LVYSNFLTTILWANILGFTITDIRNFRPQNLPVSRLPIKTIGWLTYSLFTSVDQYYSYVRTKCWLTDTNRDNMMLWLSEVRHEHIMDKVNILWLATGHHGQLSTNCCFVGAAANCPTCKKRNIFKRRNSQLRHDRTYYGIPVG
jgi:hypothetical protein